MSFVTSDVVLGRELSVGGIILVSVCPCDTVCHLVHPLGRLVFPAVCPYTLVTGYRLSSSLSVQFFASELRPVTSGAYD